MVDTGELAKYLNDKSCKENNIVIVIGEGEIQEIEQEKGRVKKVLNIPVKIEGTDRELIYTPGMKALRILQDTWGFESKNWISKKFKVNFILMQIGQSEIKVIKPEPLI